MQLVVLGKSPAWQDAGGACSGYLIREGEYTLLLDCGSGVFSRLRQACDYVDIDAVVISHLHADHFLDLIPFSYALTYGPRQRPVDAEGSPATLKAARPGLYVPAGAPTTLRRIAGALGHEDLVENAFDLHQYVATDGLSLGPLTLHFCEVPHYTPAFAVELRGPGGARLTFSSDLGPSDALVTFATGSDLLLIEATLPSPDEGARRGHLTAREAGELARRAGARRVVLTHFSDELDPDRIRAEGSSGYQARVELAQPGAEFVI